MCKASSLPESDLFQKGSLFYSAYITLTIVSGSLALMSENVFKWNSKQVAEKKIIIVPAIGEVADCMLNIF